MLQSWCTLKLCPFSGFRNCCYLLLCPDYYDLLLNDGYTELIIKLYHPQHLSADIWAETWGTYEITFYWQRIIFGVLSFLNDCKSMLFGGTNENWIKINITKARREHAVVKPATDIIVICFISANLKICACKYSINKHILVWIRVTSLYEEEFYI